MDLDPLHLPFLTAAIGRLLEPTSQAPANWPDLIAAEVVRRVEAMPPEEADLFAKSLGSLVNESWAIFGSAMPEMHPAQQDELLTRCYNDQTRGFWPQPPREFLDGLAELAQAAAGNLSEPAE
jgi:hypothetical protein